MCKRISLVYVLHNPQSRRKVLRKKRETRLLGDQVDSDKQRLSLFPLSLEDALRAAMLTGPPPEMPKRERKRRKPDEPTAPHHEESADPAERAKDAMHKAGEQARRTKRAGASGKRGSTSED